MRRKDVMKLTLKVIFVSFLFTGEGLYSRKGKCDGRKLGWRAASLPSFTTIQL